MDNIIEQTYQKLMCRYKEGYLAKEDWDLIEHLYNRIWGESTVFDWYITSIGGENPVWTDEHIEELCKDFFLIKK